MTGRPPIAPFSDLQKRCTGNKVALVVSAVLCNFALSIAQQRAYTQPQMKRTIRATDDNSSGTPYTPGVEAGGFVFISGQIAQVFNTKQLKTANVTEETQQVMENLGAVLKGAGLGFEHLVKCTIYITNLQYYAEVSRVYQTFFQGDPPARETVGVKELPRGVNVEISAIAFRG